LKFSTRASRKVRRTASQPLIEKPASRWTGCAGAETALPMPRNRYSSRQAGRACASQHQIRAGTCRPSTPFTADLTRLHPFARHYLAAPRPCRDTLVAPFSICRSARSSDRAFQARPFALQFESPASLLAALRVTASPASSSPALRQILRTHPFPIYERGSRHSASGFVCTSCLHCGGVRPSKCLGSALQ
jgi:hypothetical protein